MCLLSLLLVVAQVGQEPTFFPGDVGALRCRVAAREDVDQGVTLLTVQVENHGPVDAEPLAFRVVWRDRKAKQPTQQVFERARLPHVYRYGRPAPAGGSQRYVLRVVGLPRRVRPQVAVATAVFHRNGRVPEFDLAPSNIKSVQRSSLVGTFPVSQVTLKNPLARDVEVLLAVTLVQPRDCRELYGVRLPAGEVVDWTITCRPGDADVFVDPETPPACAMKATAIDLVDWCVVGEAPPDAGVELLREPYARWYRWPDGTGALTGTFHYRGRRKRAAATASASANEADGYDEYDASGRFSVGRGGRVRVEVSAGEDRGVGPLLQSAFAELVRPSFADLSRDTRLVPIAPDRVALVGAGWDPARRSARNLSTSSSADRADLADYLIVHGGRLAGERAGRWQTRMVGDHYVRTLFQGSSIVAAWSWCEVDGRLVPNAFQSTTTFGDEVFETGAIELTGLSFAGEELAQAKPSGPGCEALRAMWRGAFRLTDEPIEVTAKFEVRNPGTDLVWRGEKRIRGSLRQRGLGRHLESASFEFSPRRPAERELALAAAIRDRWLIWWSRDFNTRPSFDEFFGGARIEGPDAAGDFLVHGHRITKVRTAQGSIRGYEQPGLVTTFTRGKVGSAEPVVQIREEFRDPARPGKVLWVATVAIDFREVRGVVVPEKFEFTRIFGRDWGPETIVLRSVDVR